MIQVSNNLYYPYFSLCARECMPVVPFWCPLISLFRSSVCTELFAQRNTMTYSPHAS
jgi:hypothetical protein